MALTDYLEKNPALARLFTLEAQFRSLEATLRSLFNPAIGSQFRVVCVENGTLILYAENNIAANFLNLRKNELKNIISTHYADLGIADVKVRVRPQTSSFSNSR